MYTAEVDEGRNNSQCKAATTIDFILYLMLISKHASTSPMIQLIITNRLQKLTVLEKRCCFIH